MVLLLAIPMAGCSGDSLPPAPEPKAGRAGPAVAEDGRWLLSLSQEGLAVMGGWIQIGRTTKTDLESLLGPMDRTVFPKGSTEPVGFWDSRGVRIFFRKDTGIVDCLDCVFTVGTEQDPHKAFNGLFQLEGVEISKNTTKADLQERGVRALDHSEGVPGFGVLYENHGAAFLLTKDHSGLHFVRIVRAVKKQ
jgi:hypothetical protein